MGNKFTLGPNGTGQTSVYKLQTMEVSTPIIFSASYEQYLADMLIVQSIACSDLLGHYDVLKNSANGPQVGKQHGHNGSVFVTGSIHRYVMLDVFSLPYSNILTNQGAMDSSLMPCNKHTHTHIDQ